MHSWYCHACRNYQNIIDKKKSCLKLMCFDLRQTYWNKWLQNTICCLVFLTLTSNRKGYIPVNFGTIKIMVADILLLLSYKSNNYMGITLYLRLFKGVYSKVSCSDYSIPVYGVRMKTSRWLIMAIITS